MSIVGLIVLTALGSCSGSEPQYHPQQSEATVGAQIRKARIHKGITRHRLASELGLSMDNIATIERGGATPTREVMVAIQELLDCELVMDL